MKRIGNDLKSGDISYLSLLHKRQFFEDIVRHGFAYLAYAASLANSDSF